MLKIYHVVAENNASLLWSKIKDIHIHAVQVTKPFNPIEKLSHLNLRHKKCNYVYLKEIIDFIIDLLTKGSMNNQDVNEALRFLLTYLKVKNINIDVDQYYMENHILYELVQKLFVHISSSVTLEYRLHHHWVDLQFGNSSEVICGNLGMGCNESTWYGTIDGHLSGQLPASLIPVVSVEQEDDDSSESDDNTVVVEVKKHSVHSSQAIGTVVLSSFIEHNIHTDLNSLVPCILINCYTVQILMYDCVADVLLISDSFIFRQGDSINKESILLLWLFINHR